VIKNKNGNKHFDAIEDYAFLLPKVEMSFPKN
jgi:hypothetical protein